MGFVGGGLGEGGSLVTIMFFMYISPQARETKAKMNKWDYITLKSFCTAKDTINRTKTYPTV